MVFHFCIENLPASFDESTLSYSSLSCVSLSLIILSQMCVTCLSVKSGCSLRGGEELGDCDQKEMAPSGELGHDARRCLRRCNLFQSKLILVEICSVKETIHAS